MINKVDAQPFGELLRGWRQRRRISQLDLAGDADISARHLSFVETGRSRPSREMVLLLSKQLEIPLREQNVLLVAAGYAPNFPERSLDDPALQAVREVVNLVLAGHEPYPALAIDRRWTLIAMNQAVPLLLVNVDPILLKPPVNVLRLSLHPQGLASKILNLAQWRSHLLERLADQIDLTADPVLTTLLDELKTYPSPLLERPSALQDYAGVAVPLRLATKDAVLSLISTTTVFGTPTDIVVSELSLETFFPADTETAAALQKLSSR